MIDANLKRIEAVTYQLNAVVHLAGDTTRNQAVDADAALARKDAVGPLHGVWERFRWEYDVALTVAQYIESALGGWQAPAL